MEDIGSQHLVKHCRASNTDTGTCTHACKQTCALRCVCACAQVGGSFGATCGLLLMKWLPGSWHIQPGVYAMCAAAAMLGGVFRASLSVVVIFVEGSQVLTRPFLPLASPLAHAQCTCM